MVSRSSFVLTLHERLSMQHSKTETMFTPYMSQTRMHFPILQTFLQFKYIKIGSFWFISDVNLNKSGLRAARSFDDRTVSYLKKKFVYYLQHKQLRNHVVDLMTGLGAIGSSGGRIYNEQSTMVIAHNKNNDRFLKTQKN